jgi:hypothetical protein
MHEKVLARRSRGRRRRVVKKEGRGGVLSTWFSLLVEMKKQWGLE